MIVNDTARELAGAEPPRTSLARPLLLGLGMAVYTISFALPAVASGGFTESGWFCARFALDPLLHLDRLTNEGAFNLLLLASGLINPLALANLVLRMLGKGPGLRRAMAITALGFIPLSWIAIASLGAGVRIGHVAWVAGLLMMMGPEAIGRRD